MRNNYLNVQHTKLENKLIHSLDNQGYIVWGINIEVNSFPPYTKHISVKLDEDTFIDISIATDNLQTIERMIKEEMELLRLLGFEDQYRDIKLLKSNLVLS